MIRWLRSLFAWRHVFDAGVYAYFENDVTGKRMARRCLTGGYSPKDIAWLLRDDWTPPPMPPVMPPKR